MRNAIDLYWKTKRCCLGVILSIPLLLASTSTRL
jgi:hypothetical protein